MSRLGIGEVALRPGLPMRRALADLPFDRGTFWTWAPGGTSIATDDFLSGLPAGITQEGQRALLSRFLREFLAESGRLVIVEDHDASPADPWLKNAGVDRLWTTNGAFVYWCTTSPADVDALLRSGLGLFNCIVATQSTDTFLLRESERVSDADLVEVAHTSQHVVVDAFDFEGFIVWSRANE